MTRREAPAKDEVFPSDITAGNNKSIHKPY